MCYYVVTNFAYGTGPYIRITELGFAINDNLDKMGYETLHIILPHIYGNKQQRILVEEFGERANSAELILDENLGNLFRQTFYENESYAEYLKRWIDNHNLWERKINQYLKMTYGGDIVCEISRSPRISLSTSPSYFTSFGLITQVLAESSNTPHISITDQLLCTAKKEFARIEKHYKRKYISEPGTFRNENIESNISTIERVPPLSHPPENIPAPEHGEGIYVTVSGIPGLDRLYSDMSAKEYHIYANDTNIISEATEALPWIIGDDAIKWHIARSGWGSVWLSIFTETPLLVPEWQPGDDPEIYFNNKRLEELGIARVYTGQSLEALEQFRSECIKNMKKLKGRIRRAHDTLDGIELVAKSISRHLVKTEMDSND